MGIKNLNRKKPNWLKITLSILIIIVLVYALLPQYAQKALIFQKPGINDYTIFKNREITATNPQPWQIHPNYNKFLPDSQTILQLEQYQTIAFLIIKDQQILLEQYFDNYSQKSITNSFSMAKSIVGLLIGAAIDDGYIDSVNQPVYCFIDSFNTPQNRCLTIYHLLTMSSGLNWDESYSSLFSTTTNAYYGNNIKKLVNTLQVVEQPGKNFKYLSANTQLLAMIVEKATGMSISDYTAKKFWIPMGAENPALWSLDKNNGTEKAYCCFNSNARDFARWGQLILNNGTWGNDTLVSPAFIKNSVTPALHLTDNTGKNIDYYGYQWWIHKMGENKIPYMRGILGQYVFVLPHYNAVVVRLGHKRSNNYTNKHPNDTYLYLKTAEDILQKHTNNCN